MYDTPGTVLSARSSSLILAVRKPKKSQKAGKRVWVLQLLELGRKWKLKHLLMKSMLCDWVEPKPSEYTKLLAVSLPFWLQPWENHSTMTCFHSVLCGDIWGREMMAWKEPNPSCSCSVVPAYSSMRAGFGLWWKRDIHQDKNVSEVFYGDR